MSPAVGPLIGPNALLKPASSLRAAEALMSMLVPACRT